MMSKLVTMLVLVNSSIVASIVSIAMQTRKTIVLKELLEHLVVF